MEMNNSNERKSASCYWIKQAHHTDKYSHVKEVIHDTESDGVLSKT
ncbi:hypothetical protein [Shouchella patagoniensis]|nr:hypothetical protein [Shouchella patagoniensis]